MSVLNGVYRGYSPYKSVARVDAQLGEAKKQ